MIFLFFFFFLNFYCFLLESCSSLLYSSSRLSSVFPRLLQHPLRCQRSLLSLSHSNSCLNQCNWKIKQPSSVCTGNRMTICGPITSTTVVVPWATIDFRTSIYLSHLLFIHFFHHIHFLLPFLSHHCSLGDDFMIFLFFFFFLNFYCLPLESCSSLLYSPSRLSSVFPRLLQHPLRCQRSLLSLSHSNSCLNQCNWKIKQPSSVCTGNRMTICGPITSTTVVVPWATIDFRTSIYLSHLLFIHFFHHIHFLLPFLSHHCSLGDDFMIFLFFFFFLNFYCLPLESCSSLLYFSSRLSSVFPRNLQHPFRCQRFLLSLSHSDPYLN